MKVKWYGHAAFLITTDQGIKIITDPYEPGAFGGGIAYGPIPDQADIVLVSDLAVSGWSVSYLAVWNQENGTAELDTWLDEMKRVLRSGGTIILFESLGTGNEAPVRLEHVESTYQWLDAHGYESKWIRTDYRFQSVEEAAELAGFFFGEEMAEQMRRDGSTILPECTGVWWRKV